MGYSFIISTSMKQVKCLGCVCVCVCLPLRMLYRLTPSFMCMYDLQCVGFIDLYWTNIKKCSEL